MDASKNCRILVSDGGTDVRAGLAAYFWVISCRRCRWEAAFASSRRSTPLEPGEALEIIDKVGHTDLDGGAGDADGAHDKAHAVLLPGEHMLDLRADL